MCTFSYHKGYYIPILELSLLINIQSLTIELAAQTLLYGVNAVLCQNDELLLEKPFREDVGDIELRLATDSEKQQLFDALAKEGKAWDAEKKQIVNLKPKVELKESRSIKKSEYFDNIYYVTENALNKLKKQYSYECDL